MALLKVFDQYKAMKVLKSYTEDGVRQFSLHQILQ